jgi:hypothetical protein
MGLQELSIIINIFSKPRDPKFINNQNKSNYPYYLEVFVSRLNNYKIQIIWIINTNLLYYILQFYFIII